MAIVSDVCGIYEWQSNSKQPEFCDLLMNLYGIDHTKYGFFLVVVWLNVKSTWLRVKLRSFTHPWLILKSQSNLVGGFNHLEKYGSQLGWWHPIYEMENNPVMFETTNQQLVKKNSLTVGSVWDHQDLELDPHHFLDLRHDPCLASSSSCWS